jgi:hypothetical protein
MHFCAPIAYFESAFADRNGGYLPANRAFSLALRLHALR